MSVLWRDKVLSSYNGNLESVVIYDAEGTEQVAVPNGVFVTLEGLEGRGREVKKAILAEDPSKDVLLISSPEVNYEAGKELDDFVNEAGDVARAFRLSDGDVITLTEDLLAEGSAPEVGDTFVVGEGGKLTEATGEETDIAVKFVVRENAGRALTRRQGAWRFDIVK